MRMIAQPTNHLSLTTIYKFLKRSQCPSAFQRLTGKSDALFYWFLRTNHIDGKSSIDYYYIFLCFSSCIRQYVVEYPCGIFRCVSTIQIHLRVTGETEAFGSVNFFTLAGSYFEFLCQGYFVVSVQAVDYCELNIACLIRVTIQAKQGQIVNTQQLVVR